MGHCTEELLGKDGKTKFRWIFEKLKGVGLLKLQIGKDGRRGETKGRKHFAISCFAVCLVGNA